MIAHELMEEQLIIQIKVASIMRSTVFLGFKMLESVQIKNVSKKYRRSVAVTMSNVRFVKHISVLCAVILTDIMFLMELTQFIKII